MRRRLEKWSQGWVTPANRQPRQRTGPAARDSFNKSSLSSDAVGHASQASLTLASSSQDEVLHCYTEPTLRAVEVEATVRFVQAMYCSYPKKANNEENLDMEPCFLPCSLQISKEVLHLQSDFKKVLSIHLNKVTDVALLEGPPEKREETDSSAIPLWLSGTPSPINSPKIDLPSEDTDLSDLLLWDLPPIPFGQLPVCEPSLPSRWQIPAKVPAGRWVQGRPLADFDRSNVQLNELISIGLLPLHPCVGRLPRASKLSQDSPVADTSTWVQRAKKSKPSDMKSLMVIWVGSSVEMARSSGRGCRLRQEGIPTILAFAGGTEASQQRKEILRCRAEVLGL